MTYRGGVNLRVRSQPPHAASQYSNSDATSSARATSTRGLRRMGVTFGGGVSETSFRTSFARGHFAIGGLPVAPPATGYSRAGKNGHFKPFSPVNRTLSVTISAGCVPFVGSNHAGWPSASPEASMADRALGCPPAERPVPIHGAAA